MNGQTQEQRDREAEANLRARLAWCHGPERADRIMAGEDARAAEDQWRWHLLGHPALKSRP